MRLVVLAVLAVLAVLVHRRVQGVRTGRVLQAPLLRNREAEVEDSACLFGRVEHLVAAHEEHYSVQDIYGVRLEVVCLLQAGLGRVLLHGVGRVLLCLVTIRGWSAGFVCEYELAIGQAE
jgi:hypothetical protein